MRRRYVVQISWMVIYEYEVPGRAFDLSSTKLLRPWSPWKCSPSRKHPGNRTLDLMISSRKLWPLDHEAGHIYIYIYIYNTAYTCIPTGWHYAHCVHGSGYGPDNELALHDKKNPVFFLMKIFGSSVLLFCNNIMVICTVNLCNWLDRSIWWFIKTTKSICIFM
jgi:hypothetical protein